MLNCAVVKTKTQTKTTTVKLKAFCSKSTREIPEQYVKFVQS